MANLNLLFLQTIRTLKIIILILILGIASCNEKKNDKENGKADPYPSEELISEKDTSGRMLVSIEPDSVASSNNKKQYLFKVFHQEFEGLKHSDISEISLWRSAEIYKMGKCKIYQILISDKLPVVIPKKNYLIVSEERKEGVLFILDSLIFVATNKNNSSYIISGLRIIKQVGYLTIYDLRTNFFKEIINTSSLCENGIPVYNASIDCQSYKPFALNIENVDLNNDGWLDLKFYGKVASYCNELEVGYGRTDRNPIKIDDIGFSLIALIKQDTLSYKFISDDSTCIKVRR